MLRLFKNISKVLPGQASHVSCGSTTSTSVHQTPAVFSCGPSTEVTDRRPSHIRLFSWLPTHGRWSIQESLYQLLNHGQRCYDQREQWQSNRQRHSEFEAFGWGTAVVVAIQLCRALSVARIPDQESVPRPSFLRAARLLPVPPTARGVLSRGSSSSGSDSVSFTSDEGDSLSSCPPPQENTPGKDAVTHSEEVDSPLPESSTKDSVIYALESAMSQLDQAHVRTQGMAHTMMGIQYANLGCYEKAVEHFEAACQTGYSKAQFNLGLCFELGKGVQTDTLQAAYLYQQAAKQGHPLALYNLGVYCYHGYGGMPRDQAEGVKHMEEAAEAGVIQAHSFLGNHYLHSESRNIRKAVFHLKRAVEEEDRESEYLLGLCYEQGWGVHQSRRRAATLYHRAAEKGHSLAMYSLGIYYEKELGGLLGDKDHAMRLYTSASEQGLVLATERLEALTSSSPKMVLHQHSQHQGCLSSNIDRDTSDNSTFSPPRRQSQEKVNTLHTSASEPSLHERGNEKTALPRKGNPLQLSYLTLILPSLLRATDKAQGHAESGTSSDDGGRAACQDQVRFQVGAGGDEEPLNRWAGKHAESLQVVM